MNGLTEQEYQNLVLSVGTHRAERRLSPLEVALLIQKAVKAGVTRRECADHLGVGETLVSTFLKLLTLTSSIKHLVDWRGTKGASIPFSTMAELARLSPQDQIKATESALRHNLKWKEVIQLTQTVQRSGKIIEECIEDILELRPQIETRHLFMGTITSENLKGPLEKTSQSDRDKIINKVLTKLTGDDYQISGRLGTKDFTILSHHDLAQLLNFRPDEIEQIINDSVESLITSVVK